MEVFWEKKHIRWRKVKCLKENHKIVNVFTGKRLIEKFVLGLFIYFFPGL
jgi:hypothetical protein